MHPGIFESYFMDFMIIKSLLLVVSLAHSYAPHRSVTFQKDKHGIVALWHLDIHGEQAAVLRELGDINHDGQLSEAERGSMIVGLLSKTFSGVQLVDASGPVHYSKLDPKLVLNGAKNLDFYVLAELASSSMPRLQLAEHAGSLIVKQGERAVTLKAGQSWQMSQE